MVMEMKSSHPPQFSPVRQARRSRVTGRCPFPLFVFSSLSPHKPNVHQLIFDYMLGEKWSHFITPEDVMGLPVYLSRHVVSKPHRRLPCSTDHLGTPKISIFFFKGLENGYS
jgi:hypothetical protein